MKLNLVPRLFPKPNVISLTAGCERRAVAPLHRLSDELPFPPQLLLGDVLENAGGPHGGQGQH